MTESRVLSSDKVGPERATFQTLTGDIVESINAETAVVYIASPEAGGLAFFLLALNGVGIHLSMDRQSTRQMRDALQDALDSFPAPRDCV